MITAFPLLLPQMSEPAQRERCCDLKTGAKKQYGPAAFAAGPSVVCWNWLKARRPFANPTSPGLRYSRLKPQPPHVCHYNQNSSSLGSPSFPVYLQHSATVTLKSIRLNGEWGLILISVVPFYFALASPGDFCPVRASAVTKIGSMSVGRDFRLSSAFCTSGRITLNSVSSFLAPL